MSSVLKAALAALALDLPSAKSQSVWANPERPDRPPKMATDTGRSRRQEKKRAKNKQARASRNRNRRK